MSDRPGPTPDAASIRSMFDRLAPRYDLFNRLTSMGLDSHWRDETLRPLKKGMRVLDLGCGTGDLAIEAAKRLKGEGHVTGLDFSAAMLALAARRSRQAGLSESQAPHFLLEKAESLPVEAEPYDLVVSGFVLRNLYERIDAILAGVHRSLKSGGLISFVDITEPRSRIVKALWWIYMNTLVALYGWAIFGRDYPAFYLTRSANRFPGPEIFCEKLKAAGFREVKARSFMLGIITLYQAEKPRV